jgi:hypothetical protein
MMDASTALLFFGVPFGVLALGILAAGLHARSAPPIADVTASAKHDSEIPKKGWGFIGGGPIRISDVVRIPKVVPAKRDAPVPGRPVGSEQD